MKDVVSVHNSFRIAGGGVETPVGAANPCRAQAIVSLFQAPILDIISSILTSMSFDSSVSFSISSI